MTWSDRFDSYNFVGKEKPFTLQSTITPTKTPKEIKGTKRSLHLIRIRYLGKEIDRGKPSWILFCQIIEPVEIERSLHLIRVRYQNQEIDYGINV
jgi:hypothetical protein